MNNKLRPFLLIISIIFLAACRPTTAEPTAQLVVPTAQVPVDDGAAATPTAELPPPPTMPSTAVDDVPSPTTQPDPTPANQPNTTETTYQVAFVTSDDTLNVRSGPGVANGIVGELAPNADGVRVTGPGQVVAGSTWVPVASEGLTGWVNSRFLAESLTDFCEDTAVTRLAADLETAVANQDGNLLAQLVHPERGLRIHHSWWNPETRFSQNDVRNIFASNVSIDWGVQDGSGNPIVGPFRQEILPMLQEDFILATETGCDEIIHGGTAGFVQLPDGYDAVHYLSLHRPGTDEFAGMNWGTWVLGIEQWQGSYYLSFLVHYQWEI